MSKKWASADELDAMFDSGEDMDDYLDLEGAHRVNDSAKRVNIDFPTHVVGRLDRAAKRRGISRQALIKVWIFERLEAEERLDTAA